ncbi:DUF1214 domain-containing protein [Phreatobacter stygius]|uniref:DUF1214 domain-containing protein n=1 Tax=Phreatobacter stygius TaxID=1940610 RepID=UPI001FEA77CB|nr:DUF1214 domain-containing protein [Phreatobacter stygius]
MRTVTGIFLALGIGAATGLGLTAASVGRGTGAGVLHIGPWLATPKAGTTEADPYARAVTARLGTLPLALADGLALTAEADDGGQRLDGRCTYRVSGQMPPARFWTLGVVGEDYEPAAPAGQRRAFTSYEVLRQADLPIDVVIAATARPGNWLPSGGAAQIRLILRLYDTPIATTISTSTGLPAITRVACS